jgi:hypothetical protein
MIPKRDALVLIPIPGKAIKTQISSFVEARYCSFD